MVMSVTGTHGRKPHPEPPRAEDKERAAQQAAEAQRLRIPEARAAEEQRRIQAPVFQGVYTGKGSIIDDMA